MNYVVTFTDKNCIENIFRVWLPTLKQNFSGKIVIITFDVNQEDIEKLKKQDVIVIEEDNNISGIYKVISRRLEAQEKFINTLNDDDKIMLIDGADVVFQNEIDSFFNQINDKIYYSTTGTLTNKSTINWMKKLLKTFPNKEKIMEDLKTQEVVASGMLAGKKKYFSNYFNMHKLTLKQCSDGYFTGIIQAILTYLILTLPENFKQTDIHNCRVLNKDVIKENGIYKIHKTIPIIHFSCEKMKKIYKDSYLSNIVDISNKKNSLNILWLYGSVPKFDEINHWYHVGFARTISKMPNINLMLYGYDMKKIYPDIAKIPFNENMTGKDLQKEFNFNVIIMDNKNRFAYSRTLKERKSKTPRRFWLKPEFFKGLNNIPKVMLEGDYHLHFRMNLPEERTWYADRGVDLLLVRHLTSLDYHKNKSISIKWFPCSVNSNIFKPNPKIQRIEKFCLVSGYGINYYPYRNTVGKMLETEGLADIYKKRFIGQDYIKNLQSYISHISGSSIRLITPAKMFEIMASGSVLLTDKGDEYGLKELFPKDSYCTYKRDYSNVIDIGKKIINEPEFREYTTKKALKCINERHTHEIRARELIDIITKKFGISYENSLKPKQTLLNKIQNLFFNTNNKEILIEKPKIEEKKVTIKEPENIKKEEVIETIKKNIEPDNQKNKEIISTKNEIKLKKLHDRGIEIYLLKDTCYNVLINNKVGETLDIAVNREKIARKILGETFNFSPIPKDFRKYKYKNMIVYIPYKILGYLQNLYGNTVTNELKKKKKRLRLLYTGFYKFIERN
jgi:hypothetical protein